MISVCIPYGGGKAEYLAHAVASAAAQLTDDDELLVVGDGPAASAQLQEVALDRARTRLTDDKQGLCGNWNRCIALAHGELVHLLHEDDAVAEGFYDAIRALAQRHPAASLLATGKARLASSGVEMRSSGESQGSSAHGTECFTSAAAALALANRGVHCCGSVVLSRSALDELGPFDERFPYCPDEEAYLRWASLGGFALDPRPLYLQREHQEQARRTTWLCEDFVESYAGARSTGARRYGGAAATRIHDETMRRLISTATTLALEGAPRHARHQFRAISRMSQLSIPLRARLWIASTTTYVPFAASLALWRRRRRARGAGRSTGVLRNLPRL